MGKKSILFSFDGHVRSITSGGLTATDVGKKDLIGGMARVFHDRVGNPVGFSAAAAEAEFWRMLE
jgi:hypothetical protein